MRLTTKRDVRRLRVWVMAATCCVAAGLCSVVAATEDVQIETREAELEGLLEQIDRELLDQTESDLRTYVDARNKLRVGPVVVGDDRYIHKSDDGRNIRVTRKYGCDTTQAKPFFDAFDLVGDERYLRVALDLADFYLRFQTTNGFWPDAYRVESDGSFTVGDERNCRLQDGYQLVAFQYLLYAYNASGDKKYLEAALRNADYLLSIQNDNGSWPDHWIDGALHDDGRAASSTSGVLKGGSFNDGATTHSLQIMIAAYHLSKDPKYLAKIGRIGKWIFDTQLGEGEVRGWCQQYGLDNQPIRARGFEMPLIEVRVFNRYIVPMGTWLYAITGQRKYIDLLSETHDWMASVQRPDGKWAYQYLRDGTPVWSHEYQTYRYDQPDTWPQGVDPSEMHGKGSLVGAKHMLDLHRKEGRKGLEEYFSEVTELSPEAYLTARIRSARWVLEESVLAAVRRRPLAKADPRWRLRYGENSENPEASLAWRFIENVRIAEGRFTRRQLAPGARPHFGGAGRHAFRVANWFDLPALPE